MPDRPAVLGESRCLTLADLAADPGRAMTLSSAEATAMLAQVGALEAVLQARLALRNGPAQGPAMDASPPEKPKGRLLTLDEAVLRSRKSRRWFLDHWRELPFARKIGRSIVVNEREFERWLRGH